MVGGQEKRGSVLPILKRGGDVGCCGDERSQDFSELREEAGCCREMKRGEAGYCRERRDWPLREMRGRMLPREKRRGRVLPRRGAIGCWRVELRGRVLPQKRGEAGYCPVENSGHSSP